MSVKVGVISLGDNLGKSCFIATLAGVYSRSQAKSVAILSTESARDNIDLVDIKVKDEDSGNGYVFRSILNASPSGDKGLFSYGLRQGDEDVYIYDVMNVAMDERAKKEFLLECLEKLPADLTFLEIKGNHDTDWNRELMSRCDCFIVLFDVSQKGLKAITKFRDEENLSVIQRTAFVLAKYDPAIVGIKKIHKTTGLSNKALFQWPYNVQICKLAYDGILDQAAYSIIIGEANVLDLRERMAEFMRFMFDSPTRKIIREVDKWSR